MGVKEGYIQTEVGIIPEDWEAIKLGKLCSYINDGTHHTPTYYSTGIPFYSVENVVADDFKKVKYISEKEHRFLIKRCMPEQGDILLTRIGSLGITKLIDWEVNASIYVSLALLKINRDFVFSGYLNAYTKSKIFKSSIEKNALMNAIPPKINMGDIRNVLIAVPKSIPEQKVIATALSEIDGLINSLTKLIAKKINIKQGVMQKLLTGKKRLDGFRGEWLEVKVSTFGEIITGSTPPTNNPINWNGSIPWVTPTDIKEDKNIVTA